MIRSQIARCATVAVAGLAFFAAEASGEDYRYVRVADTRDGGFFLDPSRHVAINNAGNVVLYQSLPGFVSGYFSGTGGPLSTIVTNDGGPLAGLALYRPSLNDSGQIAFYGDMATPDGFRVYRAEPGGSVTLIASSGAGTFNGFQSNVSINNSGNVAFTVGATGALDGLYVGAGAANVRLYGNVGDGVSVGSGPSLNNAGSVSFAASYAPVGGLAHLKGAGEAPSVIASTAANDVSLFAESVINDGGLVVFGAFRFSAPTHGIFTGIGGSVITTFADTDGPYSSLPIIDGIAAGGFPTMNNAGTIAFLGTLDAGGAGIFTGADASTSGVIQVGSTLFGRDLNNLFGGLGREAINDAGEIAFQAQLLDAFGFSEVVVKAIPAVAQKWADDSDGVWSDSGNWLGPVPSTYHHDANFTDAITAPRTVTVDGMFTVGSINFDNANRYTIAGGGTLRLDDSYAGRINVLSGSHTIEANVNFARDTTVHVAAPGSTLTATNAYSYDGLSRLIKTGPGRVELPRVTNSRLTIDAGTVAILPNGTSAATSRVRKLEIAGGVSPTSRLDLADNDLVIDYEPFESPLATVAAQIATGYAAGSWSGNGIATSMGNSSTHGLGYAEASAIFTSFPAVFSGQSVDDTAVLVGYTRYGDADLSGNVNLNDFNRLASNFGLTSGAVWSMGDFDYNGTVNLNDFNRLAANFGLTASPSGPIPGDWSALASAVPEPALGVTPIILPLLAARSRRRSRCGR